MLMLLDIELWSKGCGLRQVAGVVIEVVEETEEGSECDV